MSQTHEFRPENRAGSDQAKDPIIEKLRQMERGDQVKSREFFIEPDLFNLIGFVARHDEPYMAYNALKNAALLYSEDQRTITIVFPTYEAAKMTRQRYAGLIGKHFANKTLRWDFGIMKNKPLCLVHQDRIAAKMRDIAPASYITCGCPLCGGKA